MKKSAKRFFSNKQKQSIVQAIKSAELKSSGEIRVHIENECNGYVMDRAAYVFQKMNMTKTKLRNGVLFYLAVKSKKFAIIGDVGINEVVADDFWDSIKDNMVNRFKKNEFSIGLEEGISAAGLQLEKHFPYQNDDINELPDEISFNESL